ncbi:MAG: hypothetical protein GY803_18705 [Chloroflexi bacterium]|nr:hypothetical protein [Chloroflexota bacterium]
MKLIPFVGWAVAGFLSGTMTFLFGEAAIRYYEAGATIPLKQLVGRPRDGLRHGRQRASGWLKQKFRRRPRWVTAESGPTDEMIAVQEIVAESDKESSEQ